MVIRRAPSPERGRCERTLECSVSRSIGNILIIIAILTPFPLFESIATKHIVTQKVQMRTALCFRLARTHRLEDLR